MTRVSKTRLVQRIDDTPPVLILLDEATGAELVLAETDVDPFRLALRSGGRVFDDMEGGRIEFEEDEIPRVLDALDHLFSNGRPERTPTVVPE